MRACLSVRPAVRRSVTLPFFGLLGATNAVYTAPCSSWFLFFFSFQLEETIQAILVNFTEASSTYLPTKKTRPIRPTMRPHDDEMIV